MMPHLNFPGPPPKILETEFYPDLDYVLDIAAQSECLRRKYGAVTVDSYGDIKGRGYNKRVSSCCNGQCVRDTLKIEHGMNTDAGAEIHAEQAALIDKNRTWTEEFIFIAGLDKNGNPMNGFDNAPCYVCARMISYARIRDVYLPIDGEWEKFSIYDIMETWERKWEN